MRTNLLCGTEIPKRIAISQFRFQKIKWNEFLYIVYNFGDIRFRNLRVYAVNNSTFCAWQYGKNRHITSNISEYPGPIYTYFTGLLLLGIIIPIFVWRSPRLRCYGNQLNFEDGRRHRQERPLLIASAFDKGLADRKSAFKILNSNIWSTSCKNLVNMFSIFSEFTLLKRAILAAIRPQFDDALHSLP